MPPTGADAADTSDEYRVRAPTEDLTVTVGVAGGTPTFDVAYRGRDVVASSRLGLTFAYAPDLGPLAVADVESRSVTDNWEPVWGRTSHAENRFNELRLTLRERTDRERSLSIVFRAYDDGVAFRYVLPEQPGLDQFQLASEDSEFNLTGDPTTWWIPADHSGRRPCSWNDTYEKLYYETPLSDLEAALTPLTMRIDGSCYVALHEADLVDWGGMEVEPTADGGLVSRIVSLPDGTVVHGEAPHRSPWRTLQIVDRPGALIESNLLENLNEPSRIDDPSWIRPGKYVGVWWEIHKGVSSWEPGPDVGATTENTKRYVDFAAEHDIPYVLAEGWNEGWGGPPEAQDFLEPMAEFDLEEVLAYAGERDVEFLGHCETFGDVENFERQLEDAFARYDELGIPGVKTGYAGEIPGHHRHDQWMVNHYRHVAEIAAEHELMLDVHEPIKPTGEMRTFPNFMTREGVRGMEINAAAFSEGGNPPGHTVTLPFTRMVAGPLDYTPGVFDITWDPADDGTRVHSTRARQLALYPIFLSGLQMVADVPEHYRDRPEFQFIVDVPVTWDETRVLTAAIGDYLTIARRRGAEWYVGSATDEVERTIEFPLDFLGEGTFVAEQYSDAPEADLASNPTAVTIEESLVTGQTVLRAPMAGGGGQAIRIAPAGDEDERELSRYGFSLPRRGDVVQLS